LLVNADGSGETRLTDVPQAVLDVAPAWSPDGDQIVFKRGPVNGDLLTMNPDGTCESALAATLVAEAPSWQAVPRGPRLGPKTCRAVAVEATSFANGGTAASVIVGTISNEGTEPLTNVLVTITAPRNDLSLQATPGYECARRNAGFVCRIDRIERGESRDVAVLGMPRRAGRDQRSRNVPLRAGLEVTADGSLLATGRETNAVYFTPRRCVTLDRGQGRIDGTPYRDRICGRRGADLIHPGDEKDIVNAGAGPDVVFAYDGRRDSIRCGTGRDLAIADAKDRVAGDCERVNRR
jgi:hypothetical protein